MWSQYSGMSVLVAKGKFVPIIGKVRVGANVPTPPQYFCYLRIHFLATELKRGK